MVNSRRVFSAMRPIFSAFFVNHIAFVQLTFHYIYVTIFVYIVCSAAPFSVAFC